MAKLFSSNTLKTFMGIIHKSDVPKSEYTTDEVKQLWDNAHICEYDETDHCITCGKLNPNHVHSYTSEVTDPTCTTGGYTTHTCVCGDTYTDNETNASGHNFDDFVVDVEATCDTAGSKSQHCSRCDATQNVTEIPALGHEYTSEVTKEATCTEAGIRTYTCSSCGHVYEEEIPALGHNFVNNVCTRCGIEVAPASELSNWKYTLNYDGTIRLERFTNETATSAIVYGAYQTSNGTIYRTIFKDSWAEMMFKDRSNLKTVTFKEGIDTSSCTSLYQMFDRCAGLTTINGLEDWDTSNVTTMYSMFEECTALTSLDLRSFDTHNVLNMKYMFAYCPALTKILVTSGKWVIGEGCNTTSMFNSCGTSAVTYA